MRLRRVLTANRRLPNLYQQTRLSPIPVGSDQTDLARTAILLKVRLGLLAHKQVDAVARRSLCLATYCRCVCGFWSTLCFVYFVSASFTSPYQLPTRKISTVIIASIWPCVGHAVAIEAMNLAEVLSFLLMPTTAHEVLPSIS